MLKWFETSEKFEWLPAGLSNYDFYAKNKRWDVPSL